MAFFIDLKPTTYELPNYEIANLSVLFLGDTLDINESFI